MGMSRDPEGKINILSFSRAEQQGKELLARGDKPINPVENSMDTLITIGQLTPGLNQDSCSISLLCAVYDSCCRVHWRQQWCSER